MTSTTPIDQPLSYTISEQAVTVLFQGKLYAVRNDHPQYATLIEALKAKDLEGIERALNLVAGIRQFVSADPAFTVNAGLIEFQGEPFGEGVSHKVLRMIEAGAEAQPLFNCLRKLRANPSRVAQEEALLFMLANNCLIHEDGDFIAFKGLKDDFCDVHSGTVPNKPGALLDDTERSEYPITAAGLEHNVTIALENGFTVISMPRYRVDDDRTRTCSFGLHVGALNFAKNFSDGQVVTVKFNPADIVSVPSDASDQKVRVCRYTVLSVLEGEWQHREVYSNADLGVASGEDDDEDDDDLEFCDNCNASLEPGQIGLCESCQEDEETACDTCHKTIAKRDALEDSYGKFFCCNECFVEGNRA